MKVGVVCSAVQNIVAVVHRAVDDGILCAVDLERYVKFILQFLCGDISDSDHLIGVGRCDIKPSFAHIFIKAGNIGKGMSLSKVQRERGLGLQRKRCA